MTLSKRNDLLLAPSGTCLFWSNQRTLCQSSGSSWKMFAATRISSLDDQYIGIWADDQYIDNLIVRSIHCPLLQIVMWFTTGQDVSTSDLNGENFYNMILSYHDVWYIIMWWRYSIESICDKQRAKFYQLEASATHDKVARGISSLVIFQYFYTIVM